MTPTLQDELQRQLSLVRWIDSNLSLTHHLESKRMRLALNAYDLALEHHASVVRLSELGLYGSMFALLRPTSEAVITGYWLQYAADDNGLNYFQEEKETKIDRMLTQLDKTFGESTGKGKNVHMVLRDANKKHLHSFTHAGHQALVRRSNDTHTGNVNYLEGDLILSLRQVGVYASLAAYGIATIYDDQGLFRKTYDFITGINKDIKTE